MDKTKNGDARTVHLNSPNGGTDDKLMEILGHSYRQILAVGAHPSLFTCAERVAGYLAAIRNARLESFELLVEHEKELTPQVLATIFSKPRPVEAIFSLNWVCSIRVLRVLSALKKRTP